MLFTPGLWVPLVCIQAGGGGGQRGRTPAPVHVLPFGTAKQTRRSQLQSALPVPALPSPPLLPPMPARPHRASLSLGTRTLSPPPPAAEHVHPAGHPSPVPADGGGARRPLPRACRHHRGAVHKHGGRCAAGGRPRRRPAGLPAPRLCRALSSATGQMKAHVAALCTWVLCRWQVPPATHIMRPPLLGSLPPQATWL